MAIFQAAVADQSATNSQRIRQPCRCSIAVEISLFNPDQAVFANAGRLEAEDFLNHEILWF